MLTTRERETIQAARDLIADPTRWCTKRMAMGDAGAAWAVSISPHHPRASRWCAHGALAVQRADTVYQPLFDAAVRLFPESDPLDRTGKAPTSLAYVNDHLGHDAVLAVFDKVLADETVA